MSEKDFSDDIIRTEDSIIDDLSSEFLDSVQGTIDDTDWENIERRLSTSDSADQISKVISWRDHDPNSLLEELFFLVSGISYKFIADETNNAQLSGVKLTDPNALEWLKKYGADEIKYISDSQREAIKKIITDGYRDVVPAQKQARMIRDCIGLDPRRAGILSDYSTNLYAKGKTDAEVWRLVERKGRALLNQRALQIAIQEAVTAGSRGFYETAADAVRRGFLDPSKYEGYRIVTHDERLCPKCSALAGESRSLPDGTYRSNGDVIPQLHLMCRCIEGIREIKMKKKEMKESGKGYADVIFEAKGLKRKDGIIFCPTVPLIEGVYNGWGIPVLREYAEFSKDSKWLNGLTVLTNHEDLTPEARRIGQLTDIANRPEGKKVSAITQFYEIDLTQREIEAIMSREPIHGSLGFSCFLDMTPGEWINSSGERVHYEAIERGPYVFYEYSMVRQGVVTPADGAGFNMECTNCGAKSQSSAPGGATMEEDQIKEMIDEAIRPLKEQNAALEQKNAALVGEVQAMKESQKAAQDAAILESFASKLKPGYTEKAKELFETYQKDPAGWVVENSDKFIQIGQEKNLRGSSSTEGGQAFDLQAEQDKLWGRAI
ncbi:MAG TPA: hypothetical protein PLQ01_10595 [Methanothrix sp.]|nr:hypothetical protein [Methanothrix sp.]